MLDLATVGTLLASAIAGAGAAVKLSYAVFDKAMDRKFLVFQQTLMDRLDSTYIRAREADARFADMQRTMQLLLDGMRMIERKLGEKGL